MDVKRTSLPIAGVVVGALALVLVACGAITAVAQSRPAPPIAAQGTPADPEAGAEPAAAVLVEGQPILWLTVGAGAYSPQFRADRIGRRLADAIHDRTLADPRVIVAESDGSSEIRVGPRLLMVVTGRDAASLGASRPAIAQQYAAIFEEAIRAERLRYAPATLLRSTEYAVLATLAFAALAWLIVRITTALRRATARRLAARAEALQAIDPELLAPARLSRTIGSGVIAARVVLLMGAADVYLTYVLGLFPWTRAVSTQLLGYAFNPVRTVIAAFAGYVPKLLFLIVIAAFINVAIRLVGAFFRPIRAGRLVFASFPAEWADPTHKIVRVVLIAFGVVVAFPYLPASESPAFAGVSVFMGVLVSLASSSALSNMIAGLVLTYTGAFRLGDRVKVGDAFGDIIETSLLATRVRTIKNEDVTIPNSIA